MCQWLQINPPLKAKYSFDTFLGSVFQGTEIASWKKMSNPNNYKIFVMQSAKPLSTIKRSFPL